MAKYNRKSKPTESFEVPLEGEIFHVIMRKLNITEVLQLRREGQKIQAILYEPDGISMTPEAHTALVDVVCSLIMSISGLQDEEGSELSWDDLSAEERHDLFASVHIDELTKLYQTSELVGRLREDEKKV